MASSIKFIPKLKELRIHLCPLAESSKGVREFIEKNYVPLKENNPKFPILIRECSGIKPKLWARYEFGRETSADLSNKKSADIFNVIKNANCV